MGESGVAGGVNYCVERCSERVWGVFKTTVKIIQIVCQLLILQSAGGWCLVNRNVFHTLPHCSRITEKVFVT